MKFLQAYLVLPAFALTYLIAAKGTLLRRLGHLVVALAVVLISSAWWVAAVELTPVADRPYIGGSGTNSALELLIGLANRVLSGELPDALRQAVIATRDQAAAIVRRRTG